MNIENSKFLTSVIHNLNLQKRWDSLTSEEQHDVVHGECGEYENWLYDVMNKDITSFVKVMMNTEGDSQMTFRECFNEAIQSYVNYQRLKAEYLKTPENEAEVFDEDYQPEIYQFYLMNYVPDNINLLEHIVIEYDGMFIFCRTSGGQSLYIDRPFIEVYYYLNGA